MIAHFWLAALAAFLAATLAAVTGFGGAAVLLPVLVAIVGVRAAIPILTVAQLIGNGSRVWFNRTELDWRLVGWFAIGAV
ncbi:MAG TPA: TSUP family transporter, partial [Gemmatimonadales bacterium]|nr:TSUP family transporter [Gemmatimonadales bacterium]